jgi:hypothetical protein
MGRGNVGIDFMMENINQNLFVVLSLEFNQVL